MAFHAIKAGEGHVFVSGGVECVSQYALPAPVARPRTTKAMFADARRPARRRWPRTNEMWTDPRERRADPDVYLSMGQTAENVATMRAMTRQRMDEWGVASQNRAEASIASGFFSPGRSPRSCRRHRGLDRRRPPAGR